MRRVLLKYGNISFIFWHELRLLSLYCQLLSYDCRLLCKITCWSSCSDFVKAISEKYGIMRQFEPTSIKSKIAYVYIIMHIVHCDQ